MAYIAPGVTYGLSLKIKSRDGRIVAMFTVKNTLNGEYYQYTVHHVLNSSPRLGFGCGLYFGGNRKAPHDIEVWMSDVEVRDI